MKSDLILAGVGGQGILSIAAAIDIAALNKNLKIKQAEVHGMSQRGGAVQSHLRIADTDIHSDLIPVGKADMILSVEPLESLRYAHYLHPEGRVVSSADPFVNIPNYPDEANTLQAVMRLPQYVLIHAKRLAGFAGSKKTENMVMLGAASNWLPFQESDLQESVRVLFGKKGERIVEANFKALSYGKIIGNFFQACLDAGLNGVKSLALSSRISPENIEPGIEKSWAELLNGPNREPLISALVELESFIPGNSDLIDKLTSLQDFHSSEILKVLESA